MPYLRIHFTRDDLTRTRLAPAADLCWETAFSLDLLQATDPAAALRCWRTWARRRLSAWMLPLLAAARPAERFPDLLEAVRRPENARLAAILDRYHANVIAPVRPVVNWSVTADRAARTRALLENGLEGLLGTLAPDARWRAPVLQLEHPIDRDIQLAGRGMVLVPSYFCCRTVVLTAPEDPTVLVHPIAPESRVPITGTDDLGRRTRGLDALLGATRAAVLQTLADGCTTTELARRVGISPATASQHATVLRHAGLISTRRQGPSVLHLVTGLGTAMLKPPPLEFQDAG